MPEADFATPEDAALSTFPRKYCYAIATRIHGDRAYVLLNTGSREQPYLYGVHCVREAGVWAETSSANAGGWSQTDHDPALGTLTFWDNAPVGVEIVSIAFQDQVIAVPVTEGAYLHVWWSVRCPSVWPHVVGYR